jgi:hypothetical protein
MFTVSFVHCKVRVLKVYADNRAGSIGPFSEKTGDILHLKLYSRVIWLTDEIVTSAAAVHNDCHTVDSCVHLCEGLRKSLRYRLHLGEDDLKAYALCL